MTREMQPRGHLDELEIASYIDGTLTESERQDVESHLSACDACRTEVITSQEAVSSIPPAAQPRMRSWRPLAGFAAAAVIVVTAATLLGGREEPSIVRADPPSAGQAIQIETVNPENGASLGDTRELAWKNQGAGTTYRITIGDDAGQPVHSASVADTSMVIPSSVKLITGRTYFWYVDAITSDGTTATSGLKSFTVK